MELQTGPCRSRIPLINGSNGVQTPFRRRPRMRYFGRLRSGRKWPACIRPIRRQCSYRAARSCISWLNTTPPSCDSTKSFQTQWKHLLRFSQGSSIYALENFGALEQSGCTGLLRRVHQSIRITADSSPLHSSAPNLSSQLRFFGSCFSTG